MSKTHKNVFISHYGKDDDNVLKLKEILKTKNYILRNSSIDSTKPNDAKNDHYIKYNLLKPGIEWASTCIVLIGPDTHKRTWVNWEIEQAHQLGKKIIGVFISGAKDSDMPINLGKYGHGTVGWNSDAIINSIESDDSSWCQSDGLPRNTGVYNTNREAC